MSLINTNEEINDNYECRKCKTGVSNLNWIKSFWKNDKLNIIVNDLNIRFTNVKAEVDFIENAEKEFSGPKQRELGEALKALGDIARYHGGDLQGNQVQKLLDDASDKQFNLLKCIADN